MSERQELNTPTASAASSSALPSPTTTFVPSPCCAYHTPSACIPHLLYIRLVVNLGLMGQTTSRRRPSPDSHSIPSPPSVAVAHSSAYGEADASRDSPSTSSTIRRGPPINRAFRNLLPRSRSTLDDSTSPDPTSSLRKRWRSSKRFSKRPSSLPNLPETSVDDRSHTPPAVPTCDPYSPTPVGDGQSGRAEQIDVTPVQPSSSLPSTLRPPSLQSCATDSPIVRHASAPEEAPLDQCQSDLMDRNLHNVCSSQPLETPHFTAQIEEEINAFLSDGKEAMENRTFVEGSSRDRQRPLPSETIPEPSAPDTVPEPILDPQPQPARHFQGPGPLVVVQGVVNTSDNPAAPQGSSTSHPIRNASNNHRSLASPMSRRRSFSTLSNDAPAEDRQSARSRLSALLPRPSSMLGRRASTPDPTADLSREISSSEHPESLLDASDDPLVAQRNASATSSEAHAHPGGESDSRPRPLSPGSIDVLGTLLSVAAAATAASLFSPNLGFQADRHSDPPSLAGIPRPMSPTPTAGLSGGEGLASLAGLGLDHPPPISPPSTAVAQQREGRDRIRNVWDSFRDRLGLNRNAPGSRSDDDSASSSEGQGNMRPGEIMLAEMARALNVGLGLNSDDSGTAGTDEPAATSTAREAPHVADDVSQGRPVPPEDSFERFLLNLQADLRTALSDDSGVALTTPAGNGTDQSGDDVAISRRHLLNELPVGVVDTEDHVEDDEPPPLEDVADSDGEDDNSDDGRTSTRTPTPMPSAHPVTHGPRDQISLEAAEQEDASNADRGRPGINLWRLYRFQPIPANQVAGHASASTSSPLAQSPAPSHLPSTPISAASHPFSPTDSLLSSVSPVPSASTTNSAGPAQVATPPAEDGTSAMVVPVIVVGLQSVEMGQVQGRGRPVTEVGEPDFGETERRSPLFDNVRPAAPPDELNTTTRGRSWQSRAATALRNLRPGRRNNSGGGRSADGAGSRTFLIYVIGGYYPPNHHMVTGSDNLDSYEALWELAELLGQVKPPVATREDIDNSGLQIIKATELDQFEQQGKVASNCVERCLICLDDYSPEEDLRLMTCKHVFHRDCVDKWLQVGRNNCPACRTKGVSTAGDLTD